MCVYSISLDFWSLCKSYAEPSSETPHLANLTQSCSMHYRVEATMFFFFTNLRERKIANIYFLFCKMWWNMIAQISKIYPNWIVRNYLPSKFTKPQRIYISKRTDSTPLRLPNICPPNLSLLWLRVSPNFASKRNWSETKRNFLKRNSKTDPLVSLVSLWSETGI